MNPAQKLERVRIVREKLSRMHGMHGTCRNIRIPERCSAIFVIFSERDKSRVSMFAKKFKDPSFVYRI